MEERKVKLLRELRSELVSRGLAVTSDLTSVDGAVIKFNIMADGLTLIAQWVTKSGIHRFHNPKTEALADFLIKTLDEAYRPAAAVPQPKKQSSAAGPGFMMGGASKQKFTGARVADTVTISREQYQEYVDLKQRASNGVFISNQAFEDIKYGYIPPNAREELNRQFNRLIRSMSI